VSARAADMPALPAAAASNKAILTHCMVRPPVPRLS
jgi:hypothetical protein